MPELPEAETIVRDLRSRVVGRRVERVEVPRPDILGPGLDPARMDEVLRGRRLDGVERRGKNVVLVLEGGIRLMVNLGMTGRLVAGDSPRAAELRHIAVLFHLDHGHPLLFDDARRFGRMDVHTAETWPGRDAELGIEPLSDSFDADTLYRLSRTSRSPIRNWLLDQTRVAGVGNIYASEALFRAGVRPQRPANKLTKAEAARLRDALRDVLQEAITARGTTLNDYRDAAGETGGFQFALRAYGRENDPCGACGTPIKRIVLSNRSAFYCPRCQK